MGSLRSKEEERARAAEAERMRAKGLPTRVVRVRHEKWAAYHSQLEEGRAMLKRGMEMLARVGVKVSVVMDVPTAVRAAPEEPKAEHPSPPEWGQG